FFPPFVLDAASSFVPRPPAFGAPLPPPACGPPPPPGGRSPRGPARPRGASGPARAGGGLRAALPCAARGPPGLPAPPARPGATLGVFAPPKSPRAVLGPIPAPPAPADPPAPTVRTSVVTLRAGDTLTAVLTRLGFARRVSNDVVIALRASGADLRRLRPHDTLEVTWTLDGEPAAVRWEPSPWLGFAAVATDAGWQVRRGETRPDARVEAVGGEVHRSLFEAIEALGESPWLVVELV